MSGPAAIEQRRNFEAWRDRLSDQELLSIFFASFDPDSIEEYLRDWYDREVSV